VLKILFEIVTPTWLGIHLNGLYYRLKVHFYSYHYFTFMLVLAKLTLHYSLTLVSISTEVQL